MRAWTIGLALGMACGGQGDAPPPACGPLDAAGCTDAGVAALAGEGGAARVDGVALLEDACTRLGYGPACEALGRDLLRVGDRDLPAEATEGKGSPYARGLAWLERGCERGAGAACYELGRQHLRGVGVPVSEAQARRWFGAACGTGHLEGCVDEGILMEGGRGGAADPRGAMARYALACARSHPRACTKQGLSLRAGVGATPDGPAGVVLLERACALGDVPGCGLAAQAWERGEGVAPDAARRRARLVDGVLLGDATAARLLDTLLGPADAGGELAASAADACGRGIGAACFLEGRLAQLGGAPAAEVAPRWQAACQAGHDAACGHLGALIDEAGLGPVTSEEARAVLHERGCTGGVIPSCLWLGRAYEAGSPQVDRDEAVEVYAAACRAGASEGCEGARRAQATPELPRP